MMVILIPIKINHEKPITKVKVNRSKMRIVIGTRTSVGLGYYNRSSSQGARFVCLGRGILPYFFTAIILHF
jgi:hypothetical protein